MRRLLRTLSAVPALLALAAAPALAAPGQGRWDDPPGDAQYSAPDITSVGAVWDGDGLGFGIGVTQQGLYSGDRYRVIVDGNRDGVGDFQLMVECCPASGIVGAWTGSGWNIDTPQSTFGWSFENRLMTMTIHRGEVGWPQGVLHFRVVTSFAGLKPEPYDEAPRDAWFILPQETAVGGVSGPGETGAGAPEPSAEGRPVSAAPAPALDPAKGRAAVRRIVRRRLGRGTKITRLTCSATLRCRVVARRGGWRLRGTARVRVSESGAYRATLKGKRTRRGCGRRCRTTVRWVG